MLAMDKLPKRPTPNSQMNWVKSARTFTRFVQQNGLGVGSWPFLGVEDVFIV